MLLGVKLNRLKSQIDLYILSLLFLFIIVAIIAFDGKSISDFFSSDDVSLKRGEYFWAFSLDFLKSNVLLFLCVAMSIYSYLVYRGFERMLEGGGGDTLLVEESSSEDYESSVFLATYVIPFLGFNFDDLGRVISYVFLMILIGAIFIKTERYYANPTLSLFGYRVYKITYRGGESKIIAISKSKISSSKSYYYRFLSKNVVYLRGI